MPVKASCTYNCLNCGNIISDYWITENIHIIECRNGLKTEKREFNPHDKCWCPRWKPLNRGSVNVKISA